MFFGGVESAVGALAQRLGRFIIPGGYTATEGHVEFPVTCRLLEFRKAFADFVENIAGIAWTCVGEDNRELLTAIPADMVGFTQALLEEHRETSKNPVANGVAEGIVYPFEIVDIDHRKAQWLVLLSCTTDFLIQ